MKRLLVLLLLTPFLLRGQTQDRAYIDSVLTVLPKMKEDTVKADLLNRVSFAYLSFDPAEGIKKGEEGLALSEKLGWKKGIAEAYNSIGSNYRIKSDYPTALDYFFKALDINETIGNKKGIANNYGNIGIIYKKQEKYPKALEYYEKALELNKELGDKKGVAINTGNIGIVYNTQHQFSKALEYELQAFQIWEELGNKKNAATWLGNISIVYGDSGLYAKALEYANRAKVINETLGSKKGLAENYRSIGSFWYGLAKDSVTDRTKKTQLLERAVENLEKAREIASGLGDLINLQEIHDILYHVNVLAGDYEAAFHNHQQFVLYKDSISSERTKEKIANIETQRELAVRDKEIQIGKQQIELDKLAVEKKRNERNFYIAGIAVLLLVIGIVYRNYKMQQKTSQLLEIEKEKSENLLLNILPSEVATELKEKGTASARLFDEVTVLLTDFVDFTTAAERFTPQQLVNELHTCFKAFDEIISRYQVEKIKTVGDAYLAVSGLPKTSPAHASNMVRAALDIRTFMEQRKTALGVDVFEVRIGIHSGSVVAGIVGVKKFAYDIWGDTVNTAARMEQNSEAGKINISQTTYDLVKDEFRCTFRGELEAKNKGRLAMYFLEGEK